MKSFDIPEIYKSPIISQLKLKRKSEDKLKRDFTPTYLNFGPVTFILARHFGFCYGVENAIETIYKTISENKGKRIFLLSEMIHNAKVNQDLLDLGITFLMDTAGNKLVDFASLTTQDIVVIPAFGTTLELENEFNALGIALKKYDTTCPFVEKVWKRSEKLGTEQYTVVIHGKPSHEETRATFSHSKAYAAAMVVKDINETKILNEFILGKRPIETFFDVFRDRTSPNFDPKIHLKKIGVVNQTTMLATETQEIADSIKETLATLGDAYDFADTRDTLCYATSDNQKSVYALLEEKADLAIVVGGFNSSNTSHLVELCHHKLKSFHIDCADRILNKNTIQHLNFDTQQEQDSVFLDDQTPINILITSGASCPDAMVDEVMQKILGYYPNCKSIDQVMEEL
jgi:4-hydroxy-3-methylbut-2-en-1-yl diphosphate reductase